MVSTYIHTCLLYRRLSEGNKQEDFMPTNREIDLERSRTIERVSATLDNVLKRLEKIEEILNEQQESKSDKKSSKVSSKG